MGVTGERESVGATALTVAARCKEETDIPVLIGVGISNPEQAREVVVIADGVVVGSALVHRLLGGAGPEGAAAFVAGFRAPIDRGPSSRAGRPSSPGPRRPNNSGTFRHAWLSGGSGEPGCSPPWRHPGGKFWAILCVRAAPV